MTIGSKLHMALTSADSLRVQCEQFGLDTEDKQAKAQFFQLAQTIEQQVVPVLRQRVNAIEQQEPQYKVKQEAFSAAGQPAQAGISASTAAQAQAMGGISATTAQQATPSPAATQSTIPVKPGKSR